jgi:hypothetical protein
MVLWLFLKLNQLIHLFLFAAKPPSTAKEEGEVTVTKQKLGSALPVTDSKTQRAEYSCISSPGFSLFIIQSFNTLKKDV